MTWSVFFLYINLITRDANLKTCRLCDDVALLSKGSGSQHGSADGEAFHLEERRRSDAPLPAEIHVRSRPLWGNPIRNTSHSKHTLTCTSRFCLTSSSSSSAHAWLSQSKREGGSLGNTLTNGKKCFFERDFATCMVFIMFFLGMNSLLMDAILNVSELFFVFFCFTATFSSSRLTFQWSVCCQWRHQIQSKPRNWFQNNRESLRSAA